MITLTNKKLPPAFAGLIVFLLLLFLPLPLLAADLPRHDIRVSLHPEKHLLSAVDTITLPEGSAREIIFCLHAGLDPASSDAGIRIEKKAGRRGAVPLEWYRVTLPKGIRTFTLKYAGNIYHPLEAAGKNQARGFDQTAGSISDEGVYLAGTSAWYPQLETDFLTFSVTIEVPPGWDGVSQGSRAADEKTKVSKIVRWDSPEPQQEIFLIASKFTVYEKKSGDLSAMVFLRTPDQALANKYLDATIQYVGMYDKLIGPYPYKKFALVENFWETGFGMPSFTLLGPTVLRLPFIINTSYPHEILHNWWGNSVFPVYEKGNWSEGITAYLADHLLKEQQGAGAEYRETTLQKYADYVSTGRDFSLTRFTSRHSPSTEAVGYGKALMFFHMLRLELGDKGFVEAIRNFYLNYKFRFATFDDVQKSFDSATGKNLKNEFDQWVTRTGAPELRLLDARWEKHGEDFVVKAVLEQVQSGEIYRLQVPVAVTMEGRQSAFQTVLKIDGKRQNISIHVPSQPLRLDIDPEFDVFRRLNREEIPPAISQALGAKKMLVIVPSSAEKKLRTAYEALAKSLSEAGPDQVEVKLDTELRKLPADSTIVVLGWENTQLKKELPAWKGYDAAFTPNSVKIGKNGIPKENHGFVLTARNPENKDMAVMLIAADRPQSLPGLARKLPHYHKYSYLAFEGDEPANIAKGRWPVLDSPMTAVLDKTGLSATHAEMGKLAAREPLISLPSAYSEERMMETVKYLSGDQLKGREIGTPEIEKAADYIAQKFKEAGLAPGGDDAGYFQTWKEQKSTNPPLSPDDKDPHPSPSPLGGEGIRERGLIYRGNQNIPSLTKGGAGGFLLKNVIGVIPGKKPEFAGQSVVVGAHYDHLGLGMTIGRAEDRGKIHPGADDNASGVAVLLELARALKDSLNPDRSLIFIAFTGEEEGKLGSSYYVKNDEHYPASKCIAMVNLDTVGRLDKKKLLVLGSQSAKEWVHIFRGAAFVTGVDVDVVSEELDSSDQKSFQAARVPAVQLFSGPHLDYHRPTDTADKIDPGGLVKIASVTREVIEYLTTREEPLTSTLKPGSPEQAGPKTERKVSLGTIPDYAYNGRGVRLSGVVPGSPAQTAGLKEGDVIVRMNSTPVTGLKAFSDFLKTLKAGDRVSITFIRDGKESTVEGRVSGR